jgi:hypothetical protein
VPQGRHREPGRALQPPPLRRQDSRSHPPAKRHAPDDPADGTGLLASSPEQICQRAADSALQVYPARHQAWVAAVEQAVMLIIQRIVAGAAQAVTPRPRDWLRAGVAPQAHLQMVDAQADM